MLYNLMYIIVYEMTIHVRQGKKIDSVTGESLQFSPNCPDIPLKHNQ